MVKPVVCPHTHWWQVGEYFKSRNYNFYEELGKRGSME